MLCHLGLQWIMCRDLYVLLQCSSYMQVWSDIRGLSRSSMNEVAECDRRFQVGETDYLRHEGREWMTLVSHSKLAACMYLASKTRDRHGFSIACEKYNAHCFACNASPRTNQLRLRLRSLLKIEIRARQTTQNQWHTNWLTVVLD